MPQTLAGVRLFRNIRGVGLLKIAWQTVRRREVRPAADFRPRAYAITVLFDHHLCDRRGCSKVSRFVLNLRPASLPVGFLDIALMMRASNSIIAVC